MALKTAYNYVTPVILICCHRTRLVLSLRHRAAFATILRLLALPNKPPPLPRIRIMHNSQSSDSVPDPDAPSAAPPDQDPVMPTPTSPPNDHIPSPPPMTTQPLQASPSDHDDAPPASPQTHPEPPSEPRPTEVTSTPDTRVTPPTSVAGQPPAVQPKEETTPLQPSTVAPQRRQQRQRGRPGRPPNINENSLMRRLECVMAVESGRMTMIQACQQYDISARTFYRWLRNKDRLIELTGFTEDDFKNGNPPISKQTLEMQDSARMPVQRPEQDPNFPRLPNQPVVSAPETRPRDAPPVPPTSATPPFAGSKRRLPKTADPNREYAQQGAERFPSPNTPYYRRNFTKMPPQAQYSRDPGAGPSERQAAARNATRMRRDPWHDQPAVEYIHPDERTYTVQYTDSPEMFKRRKVVRPQHMGQPDDPNEPIMITPTGEQATDERAVDESPFVNGNSNQHHEGAERSPLPREGVAPEAAVHGKTVIVNGARPQREVMLGEPVYDPRAPRKHRIEVMMGRRKVTLAWYDGTSAEDIKSSIARRFALLPEAQWALVDHEYDEIIISDGLPSGRYTLTVLS